MPSRPQILSLHPAIPGRLRSLPRCACSAIVPSRPASASNIPAHLVRWMGGNPAWFWSSLSCWVTAGWVSPRRLDAAVTLPHSDSAASARNYRIVTLCRFVFLIRRSFASHHILKFLLSKYVGQYCMASGRTTTGRGRNEMARQTLSEYLERYTETSPTALAVATAIDAIATACIEIGRVSPRSSPQRRGAGNSQAIATTTLRNNVDARLAPASGPTWKCLFSAIAAGRMAREKSLLQMPT